MSSSSITDRIVNAKRFCTSHSRRVKDLRVNPKFLDKWSKEFWTGSKFEGKKLKLFFVDDVEIPVIEDDKVKEFYLRFDSPLTVYGVWSNGFF